MRIQTLPQNHHRKSEWKVRSPQVRRDAFSDNDRVLRTHCHIHGPIGRCACTPVSRGTVRLRQTEQPFDRLSTAMPYHPPAGSSASSFPGTDTWPRHGTGADLVALVVSLDRFRLGCHGFVFRLALSDAAACCGPGSPQADRHRSARRHKRAAAELDVSFMPFRFTCGKYYAESFVPVMAHRR